MTRRTAVGLLLFCLLGLAASSASAYVHYRLLRDPGYTSFCGINATWNCETVYESRFGALFGVPVAVFGVIWFVAATLLAAAGSRRQPTVTPAPGRKRRSTAARPADDATYANAIPAYLFVLSIVGLSCVLYFAYISFFVLKTVCVLCLATYVAVIGIFILSGTTDIPMRSVPRRLVRDMRTLVSSPVALVLVLLFAAGAGTLVAFFPRQSAAAGASSPAAPATTAVHGLAGDQQSEFDRWYTQQPRVPIAVANDGAKVVIVKFNDYQCPPCRQTYMEYKPVLAKWQASNPGMVKFMTKDYPLEPECNVNAPGGQHLSACEAAVAVRLARDHGRGEQMEEWLFGNQPQITPALVREGARDVGKINDFDSRYATTLELVKGDITLGAQLGVKGTPTFFVNGVRIPGLKAEFFDAAIAYELKQAGVIK
jgi:uncharacterized membrane protein/protein-disulfide isomerase